MQWLQSHLAAWAVVRHENAFELIVRPRVEERAMAAAARRAQLFNERMQMRSFAPGDKVMRWREERTSKLKAKWAGPYESSVALHHHQ